MQQRAFICEMAPRDGMQIVNRDAKLPVEELAELLQALQRAGLWYIEAGSFVNPKQQPGMVNTTEVLKRAIRPTASQLAALVPNLKYYEVLRTAPNLDTVALFVSASEKYSKKNTNMTIAEALEAASKVAARALEDGYRVRAHVSYAFRDDSMPGGETLPSEVVRVCRKLREMGCEIIALADTDGTADSKDIIRVLTHVKEAIGLDGIAVHLHDRYGQAITNALEAFRQGVRFFDAAVGGIGGNQKAEQGVVGNVATEELVRAFHGAGIDTGVDLDALLKAGEIVYRMTQKQRQPAPPSKVLIDHLTQAKIVKPPDDPRDESPAIRAYHRERAEFIKLLPGLLQTHAGRFVAITDGHVVDDDLDEVSLVKRVYKAFPGVYVLVQFVEPQHEQERLFASPKLITRT